MNEEEGNNRRTLLAAVLCMGLYVVWQTVFPPPPLPTENGAKEEVAVAAAAETSSTSTAEPRPATSTSTSAGTALAGTTGIDPSVVRFEGGVEVDGDTVPYELELTNVGGGIEDFVLSGFKERVSGDKDEAPPVSLADPLSNAPPASLAFGQMAGIEFGGASTFALPAKPVYEVVESTEDKVRYRFVTSSGVAVERTYFVDPRSFAVGMTVEVTNGSARPQTHQLEIAAALATNDATRQDGGWFSGMSAYGDHLEGLCQTEGSVKRKNVQKLADGETQRYEEDVSWVGIDRQYFLAAIVDRDPAGSKASCRLEGQEETARAVLVLPPVELPPGGSKSHEFTAYLGIKKPGVLSAVEPDLARAINYTVLGINFAPLCEALLWVLRLIHGVTGSWGLAIIGLTVLIKTLLFPLGHKQGKSARAMAALRPEQERIKEEFADDRQRQNEEMMRLFKEHNVNPVSGCLPALVQLPIFFSLYRALWVSTDIYQQGFLWIGDLTSADPYFILPLILMAVTFLQQKIMPMAMDPAQQKIMMYVMPLMLGSIFMAVPAGLALYMLVNSVLSVLQQHFINVTLGPLPGPSAAAAAKS